jgi:hypothetical protein
MFRTFLAAALGAVVAACAPAQTSPGAAAPVYRVDPAWPQALPEDNGVQLVFGQVAGIAVDDRNSHVWMVHRPASLLIDEWDPKTNKPVTHRCCKSLPPVVEFDAAGRYLRGWGGPGPGYEWPKVEHGIYVDPEGNVWVGGNSNEDNQILKFTPDGKFLMQIGRAGKSEGSNSRTQLGRPAHMTLDVAAGELYVADGYGNRRVVVFDAKTGAYKRHWAPMARCPTTMHSAVRPGQSRHVSSKPCIACASPTTAWCTWRAPTTASRCSTSRGRFKTVPCRARRWPTARCGT